MDRRLRTALAIALVGILGVVALLLYIGRSVKKSVQTASIPLEDVRSLQASLEAARAAIKAQSKECAVTIDTTSVGDRDVEQEMLYLADLIEVYELKSGTRPNNVADLEKLKEAEINGNVKSLEKACTISFDLKNGGYALSCGPTRASISELGSFLDNVRLGGNVQKFLKISGKEILYIPPRKC